MKDIEDIAIKCGATLRESGSTGNLLRLFTLSEPELEAFAKALQGDSEPVYQICLDGNGNWVDVPSCEYERESINEKRVLHTFPPNTNARLAELEALSVTNIMMKVVPDLDGSGFEVYAKSVEEVETELSNISLENEDLKAKLDKAIEALENIRGSFTDLHFEEDKDSLMIRITNAMQEVNEAIKELE